MRRRLAAAREWDSANPEVSRAWDEATEEQAQRNAERERHLCGLEALREGRVPLRLAELAPSARLDTPAMVAARSFVEGQRDCLLLLGSPGCGKSLAAAWVVYKRRGGLFCSASTAARSVNGLDKTDRSAFAELCAARLLVLDDVGTETAGPSWLDVLFDARYANKLRTLMTTNLDAPAFKARYGMRLADRIRETATVASCGDKSLRGRA